MKRTVFTAITMIRGEEDIALSSLTHHARIGFDRIIVISHVEFGFLRQCVDMLRDQFPSTSFFLVEIPEAGDFSKRKGNYVNHALSAFVRGGDINVVYCFDADEFLGVGQFESVQRLFDAYQDFTGLSISRSSCPPSLATLPWRNLINAPATQSGGCAEQLQQGVSGNFYEILWGDELGKKVVFVKRPSVWVHMGFHWVLDPTSRERLHSPAASVEFTRANGLGVYHLPLRSETQLRARIQNYQASAVKGEKYNRIGAALMENDGDFALREFFRCATSPEPHFSSMAEAEAHFEGRLPIRHLEQFKPFLVAPRRFVGAVLTPSAQHSHAASNISDL